MLDFFEIDTRNSKNGLTVFPKFKISGSVKDLMVQGKDFYAVWNEKTGLWSKNEFDVQRVVDEALDEYIQSNSIKNGLIPLYMSDYSSGMWKKYKDYIKNLPTNNKQLDTKIVFANDTVKKSDYISRKLPYEMKRGKMDAYNELMSVLYEPEERKKLEWAIGAIISGDSKKIQKFIAITGEPGKGKGTFLNIIASMFDGYVSMFNAKELANGNNAFAGDAFANNPLIAIQTDGDLSRIQDNTLLNSIVSHEKIIINEKFKSKYEIKLNSFLFMATNGDIAITDYNSGIKRRLIDVNPTNDIIPADRYDELMEEIENEKGAIAYHCFKLYERMGKEAYRHYIPKKQESRTNIMYNFVETELLFDPVLEETGYITAARAYKMYKDYCDDSGFKGRLPMMKFKTELAHYFNDFKEQIRIDGKRERSCYFGLKKEEFNILNFTTDDKPIERIPKWLDLKEQHSKLDDLMAEFPAQYTWVDKNGNHLPKDKWENVTTKLKDLDTSDYHYINCPIEYIVIDFDIKDSDGKKNAELNLEAAKELPPTYAEFSQGGQGLHLHYIYDGDPETLARVYDDNIEIKVYSGDGAIRRKLTKCNNLSIAHLKEGDLPIREKSKVLDFEGFRNERALRTAIDRNLQKLNIPGTKPSVEFIKKDLDKAYESGMHYDVTDLRPKIMAFAANSTHQSELCLEMVSEMKFRSEDCKEDIVTPEYDELPIAIFDTEVFPNLFVLVYKLLGENNKCVKMINPSREMVEEFINNYRIVGFNNRDYDNHILYAWIHGYSNHELYIQSQRIINKSPNSKFKLAYDMSYTDIFDYSTKKQSLKKWEIELDINHLELGLPWDQPVPENLWDKVVEYCCNDVIATEAVWNATQADFTAREILADLTGGTCNMSTNTLILKLLFGDDRNPELIYTDLKTGNQYGDNNVLIGNDPKNTFPEYDYIPGPENKGRGRNMFRGIDLGFGGYVFAVPGMYRNVALLDVQNMHGASIENLDLFSKYTQNYANLRKVRNCIKAGDFETPKSMFDGKLIPYLQNKEQAESLSAALKLPCNQTYGLTQTTYSNPAKDERNVNNTVALRGAIVMKMLQDELEKKGFPVCHIKTDSCKVPGATPEIIKFIQDYMLKFGYVMEHECTYEKMCLVNDAVYIAKYDDKGIRNKHGKHANEWTATGTQFAVPYVFKTLFSHEPIAFKDFCETKSVTGGALYLDMNEDLPDVSFYEKCKETKDKMERGVKVTQKAVKELEELGDITDEELDNEIAKGHNYQFIGKVDSFVPVLEGTGGGILLRYDKDKYQAPSGSKGYRWQEAEVIRQLNKEDCIDKSYHRKLVDEAVDSISKYGDFEWFVS